MPLRDSEHAISSAQSNELIEWQTGKLFAYLTLRNSHINVTFRNRYWAGPSCANILIVGENNKTSDLSVIKTSASSNISS